MNDNKQHSNELRNDFEDAHEKIEQAAFAAWQAQGLVDALSLVSQAGIDGAEGRQMLESLLAALHEKISSTHEMLSQLETQMLHKITN